MKAPVGLLLVCAIIHQSFASRIPSIVDNSVKQQKQQKQLLLNDGAEMKRTDDLCEKCETFVRSVEDLIAQATDTEAELITALVCSWLPDQWKDMCGEMVQEYLVDAIKNLEQRLNPEKICTAVTLCHDK